MGRANCPLVAPDRFTRPGILPGVLVVTLPVVEGDIAFLQGHALAVEQRQTGRTQGIIAPSSHLVPCCSPFWASHLLRSAIRSLPAPAGRGENQCPSAGATPFHGALLGRGTEAGLAHMANRHHGVVGLADQNPGVGGVVQYGRGLLHHLAEGGTDIRRAAPCGSVTNLAPTTCATSLMAPAQPLLSSRSKRATMHVKSADNLIATGKGPFSQQV